MPGSTIAAVERHTGLSKDVLRVWERRYGFPKPDRDAGGDRFYPDEQVERLQLIKRLLDQGHRPKNLIQASADELKALIAQRRKPGVRESESDERVLAELLDLLKRHDAGRFQQALQYDLAKQGLQHFVQDTLIALACRVGEAWESGALEIFEEHLFTEVAARILRQAIGALPAGIRRPRVVLTTAPEEQHELGLLMFEALLALEGAECISLGARMPLRDIGLAASAHRADVLALSFSGAYPCRQHLDVPRQLRELLPPEIAIWAGGAGALKLAKTEGVLVLETFDEGLRALADWKSRQL
ncbi:MAG: MerR family transcriptional regulator [Candidatus Competibacteraceae bacterium]|nr:MerR family transcriptional regulator [Candidatus Competibacteraceae bacterium]